MRMRAKQENNKCAKTLKYKRSFFNKENIRLNYKIASSLAIELLFPTARRPSNIELS